VPFGEVADVYVINTCTVTDRADAEGRRLARRAKRLNPQSRVVMTGCFAQTSPEKAAAAAEVDYVVGVGRLDDILRVVRGGAEEKEGRIFVGNLRKSTRVDTFGGTTFRGQTRAFLKIQEGCDLFCTFCIVPFSRGRSRSIEPRRVLDEVARLARLGFREVVLTGIHLGGYGHDLEPRIELADLVEMIVEQGVVNRLRLSSIDPPEVTPRLLRVMSQGGPVCDHLHMPVQAATDGVLRRMRRQYDVGYLKDVIAEIVRTLPDIGLGTDMIAGFPGETDADFEAGFALLESLPFSYFHVFPYSRRKGTTAAKLPDQVPSLKIYSRARALRQLGERKRRTFGSRLVGRELRVLPESVRDAATGHLVGYSRNYARVLVPGPDRLINSEVNVRIAARRGAQLLGASFEATEHVRSRSA
jgi:threonylcarbamoyladenosine tRNA methylthiotransferase MtaB